MVSNLPLARGSGGVEEELEATTSFTPLGNAGVIGINLLAEHGRCYSAGIGLIHSQYAYT